MKDLIASSFQSVSVSSFLSSFFGEKKEEIEKKRRKEKKVGREKGGREGICCV